LEGFAPQSRLAAEMDDIRRTGKPWRRSIGAAAVLLVAVATGACGGATGGATPGPLSSGSTESPPPTVSPTVPSDPGSASPGPTPAATLRPGARTRIWFAPFPEELAAAWGMRLGSVDYRRLFDAAAPWSRAAAAVDVFEYPWQWLVDPNPAARVEADELRREVAALSGYGLEIAIEYEPLVPRYEPLVPRVCGSGIEGFWEGATGAVRAIERIVDAGGSVSYLSLDEPLAGAHLWDGPTACHWTVEQTAREVAAFVDAVRARYPTITIGDIEPFPAVSAELLLQWLDAYRAASGSPFPFIVLDMDWAALPSGWPADVRSLAAEVRDRGTEFAIIYNGGSETTDEAWLAAARAHLEAYELDGGTADVVIFASWNDKPDRLLPETDPTTFTHLVADYVRPRPAMSVSARELSSGRVELVGDILAPSGGPAASGAVAVTAMPRDGPYQVIETRGTVPADVTRALVGVRTNNEGPGPHAADITFYEIGYEEEGDQESRVPNGRIRSGAWDHAGSGSLSVEPNDRGGGGMMRLRASPDQTIMSNSREFSVTPGATYRLWIAARVPEASVGSTTVDLIFLDANGIETDRAPRARLPVAPAPIPVGATTTDAEGGYRLVIADLEPGRYRLTADYAGDAAHWPARAAVSIDLR
jgi:hypothetical protein